MQGCQKSNTIAWPHLQPYSTNKRLVIDSNSKIKTKDFLRHLRVLGQSSSDRIVNGFLATERELIKTFIADTEELIGRNEWGVGLENLLSNLYEIEFPLDSKAIDLAKHALKECKMNYKDWTFIEELKK